jgi:hypothetical protein
MIAALELNDQFSEAQDKRIKWFYSSFDPELYREILENATSDFKKFFPAEVKRRALESDQIYQVMSLLQFIDDVDSLADLVKTNISKIDYRRVDPSVPQTIQEKHPLTAIMLYRRMIDKILSDKNRSRYDYAAEILIACRDLIGKIEDYGDMPPHAQFADHLSTAHESRQTFWEKVRVTEQRYADVAAKLKKKEAEKMARLDAKMLGKKAAKQETA